MGPKIPQNSPKMALKKSVPVKKFAPGWNCLRMILCNQKWQKMHLPTQFQVHQGFPLTSELKFFLFLHFANWIIWKFRKKKFISFLGNLFIPCLSTSAKLKNLVEENMLVEKFGRGGYVDQFPPRLPRWSFFFIEVLLAEVVWQGVLFFFFFWKFQNVSTKHFENFHFFTDHEKRKR